MANWHVTYHYASGAATVSMTHLVNQWFTEEFGHPALKEHIAAVTALMRAAASWESFKRGLGRALPKLDTTIAMPIDDDGGGHQGSN